MSHIIHHQDLIEEIDAFLSETGMGVSYFGKQAAKNSELVPRLKAGGRVWPETAQAIRQWMADRRNAGSAQPQKQAV